MTEWNNRIIESGVEAADQLLAHPANFRVHPSTQREAMNGALGEIGWIRQVVVNEQTGRILDGHLRAELAREAGEHVPVLYVDVDEGEEHFILATLDPSAALADFDSDIIEQLRQDTAFDDPTLARLFTPADPNETPPEDQYQAQAGLIIECDSKAEQEQALGDMQALGLKAKAITV